MANFPFVAIFSNRNSSASTNRLWNHHKKTTERKRREGSCVTTEKYGTPSHLPAAHSPVSCTKTRVCACSTRIYEAQRHCYQSDWGATVYEESSKHDGISAKRNMEEKQFELLQVCAEGHLSASETPTSPQICPQGFLCWPHREVWSSEMFWW